MGFLPQIGSTYSSIAALKLDVLERGLSKGFKFATKHSARDSSIGLYCSVNAPNGDYCSCRVCGSIKGGVCVVTQMEEKHSCRKEDWDVKRLIRARTAIRKLRDQLATIGSSDLEEATVEEGEGEGNEVVQNIEGDGQKLERRLGNNDVWQLDGEKLDYYNIRNEHSNGFQFVQVQHHSLDSIQQGPNLSRKRSLQFSTPSQSSPYDFHGFSSCQKSSGPPSLDHVVLSTSFTSSDHSKSLPSFVQSFLSTPSRMPPHLDSLEALGIQDIDTLVSTLLMGAANLDRLLNEIENEETKSLILEMARDFTLNL